MKKYNEFLNYKNYEIELNEGLFDAFKKMFAKIGQYINKIKGGKEVEAIYTKYISLINQEFQKQGLTELSIGDSTVVKKESLNILNYNNFLNEAEEVQTALSAQDQKAETEKNNNTTIQKLKQKSDALSKIIELFKGKALKEMDLILTKYGGADKNPKLAIIINNKKDQFNLDFLNAKIAYLEKAGDKTMINQIKIERDKISKDLNQRWLNIDKTGDVSVTKGAQLIIGSFYRYKTPDGIKTIKIIKQSETAGKIIATYLIKEDGIIDKQQEFTIENIDDTFKPENGHVYNYYSETNNQVIKVTVENYDDSKKELNLKSEKGNTFKGHVGSLRDEVTKEKTTETEGGEEA